MPSQEDDDDGEEASDVHKVTDRDDNQNIPFIPPSEMPDGKLPSMHDSSGFP